MWIPLWTAWRNGRHWRRRTLEHLAAIEREVVTDDLAEAKWLVFQMDGHIRYVVSNPYLRHGDVGQLKDQWRQDIVGETISGQSE